MPLNRFGFGKRKSVRAGDVGDTLQVFIDAQLVVPMKPLGKIGIDFPAVTGAAVTVRQIDCAPFEGLNDGLRRPEMQVPEYPVFISGDGAGFFGVFCGDEAKGGPFFPGIHGVQAENQLVAAFLEQFEGKCGDLRWPHDRLNAGQDETVFFVQEFLGGVGQCFQLVIAFEFMAPEVIHGAESGPLDAQTGFRFS